MANLILTDDKFEAFPLRSGKQQAKFFSPLLFNLILEFIANKIRGEKEIKCIWIKKEEVKSLLFTDDMFTYSESPKELVKTLGTSSQLQQRYRLQG